MRSVAMADPFINSQSFINHDCIVLKEKDVETSHLIERIDKLAENVFMLINNTPYFVTVCKHNDELTYIPCGEIFIDLEVDDIIEAFKESNYLLVKDRSGTYTGFIEIKEFTEQLLTRYNHLHAYVDTILETIDESCTVIDQHKNVLFWTKGAEDIFSVKHDDIIGKPITNFFKPERLEILNALKEGTSVSHMQHQAREDLVVLINSNPVYLNDEIIGAVVSETDITSQIRLNNELYNASKKLFHLEKEVNNNDPFKNIHGNSPKLKQTMNLVEKAATTEANILIQGESGVGKELFAKAIHNLRENEAAPYIAINCGAIPSALFESEIFGYEKGAFSGANQKGKKGKVELAKNGTLFLDEIGEMPLDMQVKLLRLLQEKRFFRVGGTKEIEVDFRIVAATNRDLSELVKEGKFREDLYYRLNVVSLEIPPLRKRPEDIIELTHYFLYECSIKYNRPIHGISQTIMQALLQYDWPGNIRELKNVVERLVVFSEDGEIKLEDLPFEVDEFIKSADRNRKQISDFSNMNDNRPLKDQLEDYEREIILRELKSVDGNKLECAKNLDITRATLYNRMNRLGIEL